MKIVHVAPSSPYNEGWGYQDNLLPKYHVKEGHEVSLIILNKENTSSGLVTVTCDCYRSPDGFDVIRKEKKKVVCNKLTELLSIIDVYTELIKIDPDLIFVHGLSNLTIRQICKYKHSMNNNVVVVQDNHADYNIGPQTKNIIQKGIRTFWRYVNRKYGRCVSKVYGVTPWRKQYAEDYYKIPAEKSDVLIMGADEDQIPWQERTTIRDYIRRTYGVNDKDFLIVTGGKIDRKKKIDVLVNSCVGLENVKLLVFGSVDPSIKEEFENLLALDRSIIYIGWIPANKVYDYFFAADLIFFPGQHSVLWEQACASKVPCVFEKWDGMDHVNNGGNSDFVTPITVKNIQEKICELRFTNKYLQMKENAESSQTDIYLYSEIAKKSLECCKK